MTYRFTGTSFNEGDILNLVNEDGLILKDSTKDGEYTSKVIKTKPFSELVASWNSKTSPDCDIEVKIRVQSSQWSKWLSYGKWIDQGMNIGSISNQSDDVAKISIDEIICKEKCEAFQFKVVLTSKNESSPKLRNLYVSLNSNATKRPYNISDIDIEVPTISQMEIPSIGKIICSPTALSMVMNYYGMNTEVIDTSQGCFDNGAGIYGNWSYNVAYAGERGLDAYVKYCNSADDLMKHIQMGIPLVASIKTKDKDELTNAPQAYPSGHLIVIRGFLKGEKDYIIVNDPAAKSVDAVKIYYLLEEFLKVWNNIIYVIRMNRV